MFVVVLISGNELSQISSELSGLAAFFAEDGTLIFSDPSLQMGIALPSEVSGNLRVMQIQTVDNGSYITVSGQVIHGGTALYLLMATDIGGVAAQREQMMRSFVQIYFVTLAVSMVGIFILSMFITRPLKRVLQYSTVSLLP